MVVLVEFIEVLQHEQQVLVVVLCFGVTDLVVQDLEQTTGIAAAHDLLVDMDMSVATEVLYESQVTGGVGRLLEDL